MSTHLPWTAEVDAVPMNSIQKRWIDRIRKGFIAKHHGEAHVEAYEFKRFEATTWAGKGVALALETGRRGDEGTLAETYCRTAFLIVLGPRGAVQMHDNSLGARGRIIKGRHARWMVV